MSQSSIWHVIKKFLGSWKGTWEEGVTTGWQVETIANESQRMSLTYLQFIDGSFTQESLTKSFYSFCQIVFLQRTTWSSLSRLVSQSQGCFKDYSNSSSLDINPNSIDFTISALMVHVSPSPLWTLSLPMCWFLLTAKFLFRLKPSSEPSNCVA